MQFTSAEADEFISLFLTGEYFLIDVRSTGEFRKGHIPGAFSLPLLDDDHRAIVGTVYKQQGRSAAVEKGFELAGPLFHQKIKSVKEKAGSKTLLVYCWRGGMRSNIMAWLLKLAGFRVVLLNRGYKNFRHLVINTNSKPYRLRILGGKTGSGKTEFLKLLKNAGEQVVCLESIASHRGSVFGHLGMPEQPTQEHFENLLMMSLITQDPGETVWVENESRAIGNVNIPNDFFDLMRAAPVTEIEIPQQERLQRILLDYGNFPLEILVQRTERIAKRLGGQHLKAAVEALQADDKNTWLEIILTYYDKTYMYNNSLRTTEIVTVSTSWEMKEKSVEMILGSVHGNLNMAG